MTISIDAHGDDWTVHFFMPGNGSTLCLASPDNNGNVTLYFRKNPARAWAMFDALGGHQSDLRDTDLSDPAEIEAKYRPLQTASTTEALEGQI